MDLDLLVIASGVIQLLCFAATVAILSIPRQRGETELWRRLGMGRLRKALSKRLRTPQPLAGGKTERIAVRNIRWHLLLTFALLVQTLLATTSQSLALRVVAILYALPAGGWLAGSIVQRQKIALLGKHRLRQASRAKAIGGPTAWR